MPAYPVVDGGNLLHTTLAKANLFCHTFQDSGQSGQIRAPANLHNLIISSWAGGGDYNSPFTSEELVRALSCMRMTSPGGDNIHNGFLKALGPEHHGSILTLFNQSFQLGILPTSWKEGVVLPILKPGKDPSLPSSYRPITLLSCLGKLLERLVAVRLEYIVDHMKLLSTSQCGF
jgi:hypothetical protein